ncbi:hypothetical protein PAXRUDRAFT_11237 [Paxillus rubicundulus Ve08.2h10]|uniref:Uncharacterized protein n=1 Tax=Paxillus rubicundulus Ve08.2h10 TaxID=930991 RepID=A0A0D0DZ88_9AGAM|nr:hypothetical protein PAXRUDRAFT_11237 [Paxillus rubicundulus Ve08.2h10]
MYLVAVIFAGRDRALVAKYSISTEEPSDDDFASPTMSPQLEGGWQSSWSALPSRFINPSVAAVRLSSSLLLQPSLRCRNTLKNPSLGLSHAHRRDEPPPMLSPKLQVHLTLESINVNPSAIVMAAVGSENARPRGVFRSTTSASALPPQGNFEYALRCGVCLDLPYVRTSAMSCTPFSPVSLPLYP